jgi:uncharacterized membrane protein
MNRAELKAKAKAQIKGKIGILFLITLIMSVISTASALLLGMIPVVGELIATIIVTPAFALSTVQIFLSVTAGNKPEVMDVFGGFNDFWAAFKVSFLTGLYTFLWSLLFVVPGIIKSISYSMSMYILAENKGKSARECINESKAMTNGHKWDLFVLDLSFFGWALLVVLTAGIASIWVAPYIQATLANAYNALKAKDAPVDAAVIAE